METEITEEEARLNALETAFIALHKELLASGVIRRADVIGDLEATANSIERGNPTNPLVGAFRELAEGLSRKPR